MRTQGSRQPLPALLDLLRGDKEPQRGVYRQEEANQADSLLEKILLVLCRHCAEGWEWSAAGERQGAGQGCGEVRGQGRGVW